MRLGTYLGEVFIQGNTCTVGQPTSFENVWNSVSPSHLSFLANTVFPRIDATATIYFVVGIGGVFIRGRRLFFQHISRCGHCLDHYFRGLLARPSYSYKYIYLEPDTGTLCYGIYIVYIAIVVHTGTFAVYL